VGAFLDGQDFGSRFVFHGFGMDAIAVVVVADEKFFAAGAGGSDEAAGLVRNDLARAGHAGGKEKVGASP
jgi:hypothetical protein